MRAPIRRQINSPGVAAFSTCFAPTRTGAAVGRAVRAGSEPFRGAVRGEASGRGRRRTAEGERLLGPGRELRAQGGCGRGGCVRLRRGRRSPRWRERAHRGARRGAPMDGSPRACRGLGSHGAGRHLEGGLRVALLGHRWDQSGERGHRRRRLLEQRTSLGRVRGQLLDRWGHGQRRGRRRSEIARAFGRRVLRPILPGSHPAIVDARARPVRVMASAAGAARCGGDGRPRPHARTGRSTLRTCIFVRGNVAATVPQSG